MTKLSLRWVLSNAGSADFYFHFMSESVKIHTTYVGDGLGSLIEAAVDLQNGSRSAIAYLPAEPGGNCMFFGGAGIDVYIQIVQFTDMESESSRWSGGKLRWSGRVDVRKFVQGVAIMAEEVLSQCGGVEGYSQAWSGAPFPVCDLESLQRGLSA